MHLCQVLPNSQHRSLADDRGIELVRGDCSEFRPGWKEGERGIDPGGGGGGDGGGGGGGGDDDVTSVNHVP